MNNLKSNTFFTICKDELETIKISKYYIIFCMSFNIIIYMI